MYDGGKESDSAWRPPQQHLPSLSSATSELSVSILKYKGRSQKAAPYVETMFHIW